MARAETAVVVALVRERDAAEMGADADQHEPLVVACLDALLVGLRIGQAADVDLLRASSISFLVRWLMKIGLPRQNTLMTWPSAIGPRSTSIGAPAAIVEASGFICAISGTSDGGGADGSYGAGCDVKEIASCRLGRKLLSQSKSLFGRSAHPRGEPQTHCERPVAVGGGRAGRPPSPGEGRKAAIRRGLLAPLQSERKPARAAKPRVAHEQSRTNPLHTGRFRH